MPVNVEVVVVPCAMAAVGFGLNTNPPRDPPEDSDAVFPGAEVGTVEGAPNENVGGAVAGGDVVSLGALGCFVFVSGAEEPPGPRGLVMDLFEAAFGCFLLNSACLPYR